MSFLSLDFYTYGKHQYSMLALFSHKTLCCLAVLFNTILQEFTNNCSDVHCVLKHFAIPDLIQLFPFTYLRRWGPRDGKCSFYYNRSSRKSYLPWLRKGTNLERKSPGKERWETAVELGRSLPFQKILLPVLLHTVRRVSIFHPHSPLRTSSSFTSWLLGLAPVSDMAAFLV